jgi:hypothetical protein
METLELIKIQEKFDTMARSMQLIVDEIDRQKIMPRPNRSKDVNELYAAMAKAQSDMDVAYMSSENPYFKNKYADLTEIVRVSRPALTKNGLAVLQQILPNDEGQNVLYTILTHSSGQFIESAMKVLPQKTDVQSIGSYITYLRRYCYATLIGVVVSDEDDDGEVAVAETRRLVAKGTAINTKYSPGENRLETITKEQLEELEYELSEFPDLATQVLEGLRIQNLADMPKSKFLVGLTRIREIKQTRNGK